MQIMVLNETYVDALRAHRVPLNTLADYDVFMKYLTFADWQTVGLQTAMFTERFNAEVGFKGKPLQGVFTSALCSEQDIDVFSRQAEALSDNQRQDLWGDIKPYGPYLACEAVDANTVILYADSSTLNHRQNVLHNIFCAMALIMPVDAVMKTDLYERFVQTL